MEQLPSEIIHYCSVSAGNYRAVAKQPKKSDAVHIPGFVKPDVVLIHQGNASDFLWLESAFRCEPASKSLFIYSSEGNPKVEENFGLGDAKRITKWIKDLVAEDFLELLAYGTDRSEALPACCQSFRHDFTILAAVVVRGALVRPEGRTKDWIFETLQVTNADDFCKRLANDKLPQGNTALLLTRAKALFDSSDATQLTNALVELAKELENALRCS